jgi:hypothetical protein
MKNILLFIIFNWILFPFSGECQGLVSNINKSTEASLPHTFRAGTNHFVFSAISEEFGREPEPIILFFQQSVKSLGENYLSVMVMKQIPKC